jgi:hypothetical protein
MINKFLAERPSTNGRIFATMFAFVMTVGVVLYCIVQQIPLDQYEYLITSLFVAEGAFAGIDVAQYIGKRKTHMEAPPTRPDVEDAKAIDTSAKPDDGAVG